MNIVRLGTGNIPTPTIHREAEELAQRHGFGSVEAFASDIAPGESVIDIGASLSHLGHAVTRLRSDITWVNMDIAYADDADKNFTAMYHTLRAGAPNNLHYLAGNIVSPPAELTARSFGRVLSFWMLPHIVQRSHQEGLVAVSNMLALGTVGGTLSVGPLRSRSDNAGVFSIPASTEDAIALAVKITKPWTTSAQ
jgi:hypothetical protein